MQIVKNYFHLVWFSSIVDVILVEHAAREPDGRLRENSGVPFAVRIEWSD